MEIVILLLVLCLLSGINGPTKENYRFQADNKCFELQAEEPYYSPCVNRFNELDRCIASNLREDDQIKCVKKLIDKCTVKENFPI